LPESLPGKREFGKLRIDLRGALQRPWTPARHRSLIGDFASNFKTQARLAPSVFDCQIFKLSANCDRLHRQQGMNVCHAQDKSGFTASTKQVQELGNCVLLCEGPGFPLVLLLRQ
jgi:hypothetical protein